MLAPGATTPGVVGEPTTRNKVLRSILQPPIPPRPVHALPHQLDKAALANHGSRTLNLGHPQNPHTNQSRPRHTEGRAPQATPTSHLRLPRRQQNPQTYQNVMQRKVEGAKQRHSTRHILSTDLPNGSSTSVPTPFSTLVPYLLKCIYAVFPYFKLPYRPQN